jgi:predicted exporter
VSATGRALWLGDLRGQPTSVVMLRGLHVVHALPLLAAAADGLPGVRWVDKTAEVAALLGRYRVSMAWLLVLGHVLVLLALGRRFGRHAWRAWLPTALATGLTLAVFGALGQPVQLFHVLALALLLGVGVDYGIFLLEHPDDGSAWLAVVIGALSTWLSFGLLALSATPALRAFGLTLLIGLALVAGLAPVLRAPASSPHP